MNEELNKTIDPAKEGPVFTFKCGESDMPILQFMNNGDIYIWGRLAATDLEVVDALREFLELNKPHDNIEELKIAE